MKFWVKLYHQPDNHNTSNPKYIQYYSSHFILSLMQTEGGRCSVLDVCRGDLYFTIHSIPPFKPIFCPINYHLTLTYFQNISKLHKNQIKSEIAPTDFPSSRMMLAITDLSSWWTTLMDLSERGFGDLCKICVWVRAGVRAADAGLEMGNLMLVLISADILPDSPVW